MEKFTGLNSITQFISNIRNQIRVLQEAIDGKASKDYVDEAANMVKQYIDDKLDNGGKE